MSSIIQLDKPRIAPRYTYKGEGLWSVTQILSLVGFVSFEGIDPAVLKNKGEIGTEVHHYAALTLQDKPRLLEKHYESMSDRAKDYATSIDAFLADYCPTYETVFCEKSLRLVEKDGLRYAGTPDLLMRRGYIHTLFDFKTREMKFYDAFQGSGYTQLIYKKLGLHIPDFCVVELLGLNRYKIQKIKLTAVHKAIFNASLTVVLTREQYNVI